MTYRKAVCKGSIALGTGCRTCERCIEQLAAMTLAEAARGEPTKYVCGFLFCRGQVLLLRKRKPDWQAGLLNGVGGARNPGEWAFAAMEREWREEAHGCAEWPAVPRCNDVGEIFESHDVDDIAGGLVSPVVGNLRWLIPLALDWRRLGVVRVESQDNIRTKPTW